MIPFLHHDDDLLVVDKPAGLMTHRSELAPDRDVAMMRARDTLQALQDARPGAGPNDPPAHVYPIHRLDRGTSGALAFALTEEAARHYRTAFDAATRETANESQALNAVESGVQKVYYALARGTIGPEEHVAYAIPKAEGKERVMAVTDFRLLYAADWFCVVEARPHTGKYHQIRRHLAHLRHPIAGDTNYGTGWFTRKVREEGGLTRLALHASSISFPAIRPGGARITVRAPLAEDFRQALLRLGVPETLVATL